MKNFSSVFIVMITMYGMLIGQPALSDITPLPPTGLNLLEHERIKKEHQSLQKIKNVMTKVFDDTSKKSKIERAKKSKKKLDKNSRKKSLTQIALKQQSVQVPHLHKLLEQSFASPELAAKKISVHLKKIDIRNALELIAKMAGITCVVDGDVQGYISDIKLQEIAVGSALQLLLSSNNPALALLKQHDVWRVVTLPVAATMLCDQLGVLEEQQYGQQVVTIFHAKWDDAFKKRVEHLWQGVVGNKTAKDGVYVMFDDASKKLFFRAKRQQVDDFTEYLKEIDQPIAQVKIEGRVIIANKDFDENFGIQWSGIYDRRSSVKHFDFFGLGSAATMAENVATGGLFKELIGWSLNFLPTGMVTSGGLNLPIVFGGPDLSTKRLNLLLNAAETRNEIKTILKPSLLVNSQECAEILVGEQLPQETRVDETIEGKLTNVTTTQYKDIGMKIKVQPAVSPDNNGVFLDVYVENSTVVPQTLAGGQTVNNGGLFTYTIETSRSKNRVLLRSGQTTLISGLIVKSEQRMKTGIPYLQDVPVLGWLFKGSRKHLVDKQILIFITPTVV